MLLKNKLISKKLDSKLHVTQKYFEFLDEKIQDISKEILNNDKNLTDYEFRILADYALATLHDNWENLNNRGYSILHLFCWYYWYGNTDVVIDPYGYKIFRNDFGTKPNQWNVDHIFPHSKGGITTIENGIPISYEANELKSNNIMGQINGKNYEVQKVETKQGPIGILKINSEEFKPCKENLTKVDFNKIFK